MTSKSNKLARVRTSYILEWPASRVALLACMLGLPGTSNALSTADLQRAADRANSGLPRMVASNLRQERVTVGGMELIYLYTHTTKSAAQLQPMNLSVSQRPYIFPQICSDPITGRMLREGATFRYVYRGTDGEVAGTVVIHPADCNVR